MDRATSIRKPAPATTPAPSLRSVEASSRLRAVVQGAVKHRATPQQSAGLQAAIDRFNADRKEAAVRYIVAALDRHLKLTSPSVPSSPRYSRLAGTMRGFRVRH